MPIWSPARIPGTIREGKVNEMPLTIDGQPCNVRDGQSILDVARENGIFIPTLCAHPKLGNQGACRLCCVEALSDAAGKPLGAPKLISACTTMASAFDSVRTCSQAIESSRRITLALLRRRLGDDGALAELIDAYGAHPGLAKRDADKGGAAAGDTLISPPNCILCGLCVRACDRAGKHALVMEGMGGSRRVGKPTFHGQSPCDDCGLCLSVCPTGAAREIRFQEVAPSDGGFTDA